MTQMTLQDALNASSEVLDDGRRAVREEHLKPIVDAAKKYDNLEQLGWYDPGSKRFCYSDEKEAWPDTKQGYTIPVFIGCLTGMTHKRRLSQ